MERQLAAVLAADVAEYSRLMGEDAEGTLGNLRRLRAELFGPMVAGHRGTVVKSMGDGWIVTFGSAADAVTCAMRLQDKMVVEPAIRLRAGVHIGDITQEEEDVFGSGVNVAARLEALCEPGGVTISDAVFGSLDSTLRPAFDDAGEQSLKNIDRPVRVWTRGGITGVAALKDRQGMEGFPRFALRPVSTSSKSTEVQELADALTHDLEAFFGGNRWLRTKVSTLRAPDAFTLSANLRVSGTRLRLEARLTDPEGVMIWNDKHDGALDDAFDWQDLTASAIAPRVIAKISEQVLNAIEAKPESDLGWEELTIRATQATRADSKSLERALGFVSRAIAKAPASSYPYDFALAAWASATAIGFRELSEKYAADTKDWLARANVLSGPTTSSRALVTFFQYVKTGDIAQARRDVEAFLRDMPFDGEALVFAGVLFNYIGDPDNALKCLKKYDVFAGHRGYAPVVRMGTAAALTMLGRFDEAVEECEVAIRLNPDYPSPYRWKAVALALLGRLDEARAALAVHDRIIPGMTISDVRAGSSYADTPTTQVFFNGLRMVGMPE